MMSAPSSAGRKLIKLLRALVNEYQMASPVSRRLAPLSCNMATHFVCCGKAMGEISRFYV
jgi:hypothetical protein